MPAHWKFRLEQGDNSFKNAHFVECSGSEYANMGPPVISLHYYYNVYQKFILNGELPVDNCFHVNFKQDSNPSFVFLELREKSKTELIPIIEEIQLNTLENSIFFSNMQPTAICDYYTGVILQYNTRVAQLFNVKEKDTYVGKHFSIVEANKISFQGFQQEISLCLKGELEFREVEYKTLDNNTFWGRCYVSELQINERKLISVTLIPIDIEKSLKTALKKQESLYKLIEENTSDLITLHDENGYLLYINSAVEKMLGYSISDVKGENVFGLIEKNHKKNLILQALEAFKTKSPFVVTYQITRKFGDPIWMESTLQPIKDSVFKDARFMVISRNIDMQYKHQKQILEFSQQLESITSNLQEGVYRSTLSDGIIFANQSFLKMFGFQSFEELNLYDTAKLYANAEERSQLTELLLTVKSYQNEKILFKRKDGSLFYGLNNCRLDFDTSGVMVFDGAIIDMSDFFEQELKLKDSEERYRLLAENATDIIVLYNSKLEMIYISPSCKATLGYTQQEIMEAPHLSLVHPEDAKWVDKLIKKLIEDKIEQYEYTYRLKTKNNGYLWIEVNSKRNFDDQGILLNVILNVRDVTEKIKTQNQLRQAKVKAEKALKTESEFLSVMSHEIRTPLNAILGMANLLKERNSGINQTEIIETLSISSQHLMHLVSDILDFKKIADGKISFEEIEFNPLELFSQAKKLYQANADEKNTSLVLKTSHNIPEILLGDPTRLLQVINNLLSNAIKFTKEGKVVISINFNQLNKDRGLLIFSIKDNGIGIDSRKKDTIFEAFKQENPEINRLYGGTGLGLTIVKSIVDQLNGEIVLESQKGEGSEFTVSLPLKIPNTETYFSKEQFYIEKEFSDLRVFYVDDVELNLLLFRGYCNSWGVSITTEVNSEKALEYLLGNPNYDMICLDLQMPGLDGYNLALKLRNSSSEKLRKVPIYAITAKTQDEVDNLSDFGFNGYLLKPINPDRLKQLFAAILEGRNVDKKVDLNSSITQEVHKSYTEQTSYKIDDKNIILLKELQNLFDTKSDYLNFIELTKTEIEKTKHTLKVNLEKKNNEEISSELHRLKGFISHFGLQETIKLITETRELLKYNDESRISENCSKIDKDLEKIRIGLTETH
ncbi:MAG: PAS domain S-box protein [Luteibaculaceae bacterium]